jgi:PAS domain S-box-containing protein
MILNAILAFFVFVLILLYVAKSKQANRLKNELENYKKVWNAIDIPIFIKDKNGNVSESNKAFDIAFKDCKQKIIKELSGYKATSKNEVELTYDNAIVKSSIIYYSNFLDGGVGVIFDISEIVKSKKSLLKNYEALKLSIQGSQDGYWEWDIKSNGIKLSKKAREILGYKETEKSPTNMTEWMNIVESYDMAKVNEALATHINGNSKFIDVEHRLKISTKPKWISIRGEGIYGSNNEIIKVYGTIRDITKQKEELSKLKIEKELYTTFIDNLPAIFYLKDKAGRYVYANNFYQKLIGFQSYKNKTDEELFGEDIAKNIKESDREAFYESIYNHIDIYEDGKFSTYKLPVDKEKEKLLFCFGVKIS